MDTISKRIVILIETKGITRTQFAEALNVAPAYVSKIINKNYMPSDRVIEDICRKYAVSEQWLRTGAGDMFVPLTREQRITRWVAEVMREEPPTIQQQLLALLTELPPEWWRILEDKAVEIYKREQGENPLVAAPNDTDLLPNAAHQRTDRDYSEAAQQVDNDIMNDDDF